MDAFDHLRERDLVERSLHRVRATLSRATLNVGDDSGAYQTHQIEGFPTELRNNVQRLQSPGFTSMPLPGAKALVSWQSGHRGFGSIIGIEDGRYRVTGLKPGEFALYVVYGADAKGENGTAQLLFKGTADRTANVLGLTINIGDSDTQNVTVKAGTQVTVHAPAVVATNGGTPHNVLTNGGSGISTVLKADS